jgi:RimJ/RimL family protein N-acetyltransferase
VPVRDVRWEDFPGLLANYYALYEEVKSNPDLGITLLAEPPSYASEAEWFASVLKRQEKGEAIFLVAEEGGQIAGSCSVNRLGPSPESGHVALLGIMVAEAYRGRGIGRALMTQMIANCRGKFEMIELIVFRTNERARALYLSLGFRTFGILPDGVRRGGRYTDVEYMVLDLREPSSTPPGA